MLLVNFALCKGTWPPSPRAQPPWGQVSESDCQSAIPAMLPLSTVWSVWTCPMVMHAFPEKSTGLGVPDREPSQGRPSLDEGH